MAFALMHNTKLRVVQVNIRDHFGKPRRRRQRGRDKTRGLKNITIAQHVRFQTLYIS